jgi:hypothetical protein
MLASFSDAQAGPFGKGSRRVSLFAGSGRTFDNSYFIIGLGFGYYLLEGLEIGLDGEAWLGDDPDIYKLSPQVKYVLPMQSKIRPYVGAFYGHVFIDEADDLDSIGGRGGICFIQDDSWYIGAGVVYESHLDCDESVYNSCDDIYPEITIAFSF